MSSYTLPPIFLASFTYHLDMQLHYLQNTAYGKSDWWCKIWNLISDFYKENCTIAAFQLSYSKGNTLTMKLWFIKVINLLIKHLRHKVANV